VPDPVYRDEVYMTPLEVLASVRYGNKLANDIAKKRASNGFRYEATIRHERHVNGRAAAINLSMRLHPENINRADHSKHVDKLAVTKPTVTLYADGDQRKRFDR
jgi:hypothetical protein